MFPLMCPKGGVRIWRKLMKVKRKFTFMNIPEMMVRKSKRITVRLPIPVTVKRTNKLSEVVMS